MSDAKISARAVRLRRAAELVYGERGGTRFAESIGISKQLFSAILVGRRAVTDDVERRAAEALRREAKRLRTAAAQLDAMASKMRNGDQSIDAAR